MLNDESIEKPLLIGGSPFDFIRFRPPQPGETDVLRLEIEVEGEIDGDFSIRTVDEFPLPGGTGIAVYNIDPRTNLDPTTGDWNGPQFQTEPTFTCLEPSLVDFPATDAHLLVVGPGDLRPEEVESFELQFDRPLDSGFNNTPVASVAWLWISAPLPSAASCIRALKPFRSKFTSPTTSAGWFSRPSASSRRRQFLARAQR